MKLVCIFLFLLPVVTTSLVINACHEITKCKPCVSSGCLFIETIDYTSCIHSTDFGSHKMLSFSHTFSQCDEEEEENGKMRIIDVYIFTLICVLVLEHPSLFTTTTKPVNTASIILETVMDTSTTLSIIDHNPGTADMDFTMNPLSKYILDE